VVAEVGGLNSNVLFEVGYALAQRKNLWLALDETDTTATRGWRDLGLLSGVGYIPYGGNSEALYQAFAERRPDLSTQTLWDDLLTSAASPRELRGLFYFPTSLRNDAARSLDRALLARRDLVVLNANEDDHGLASLAWYVGQIYRSSAGLIHLLGPQRTRSQIHNARASLLAGICYGLELPTLMVAEEGFHVPLDYRDLLYQYLTSKGLTEHVNRCFLGIETGDGNFDYPEGEPGERRARVLARRFTQQEGRPARLIVHPAFRPYLQIRDVEIQGPAPV
jgi:hypothetical protein